jgi:hypothetical protein
LQHETRQVFGAGERSNLAPSHINPQAFEKKFIFVGFLS